MKKRIFLASLQRKQEQEEAKARKEQEAQARREREKAKEEEKARKKEEQIQRRAAILEQYKLKKAMEEAEREGKVFDKSDMMGSLKPTPKMRPKAASRPRPKTIHIDSGSVEMAEGMMQPSRGKKGSTSNLTANSTMKRDYYRGSQDSLADRSMSSGMLYRGVFLFYFVFIFYLCGDCLEILVVTIGAGPFPSRTICVPTNCTFCSIKECKSIGR
jgi:hypothetical protein